LDLGALIVGQLPRSWMVQRESFTTHTAYRRRRS
jgi:hypothetical protein